MDAHRDPFERFAHVPGEDARRRVPRYPTYLEGTVEAETGSWMGTILSLSLGGIFIGVDAQLPVGALVRVTFEVPDLGRAAIPGIVIYRATYHGRAGVGIMFPEPLQAAEAVEGIRDWFDAYR